MMRWYGILMLGALALCACSTPGAQSPDLAGTTWRLTSFGDGGAARAPIGTVPIIMAITRDDAGGFQVGGTSGCNQYAAALTVDGTSFLARDVAGTMMACVEPGIMEQEGAYLTALSAARVVHVEVGELHLIDEAGTTLLVFAPATQP
ncbi:MAG: META domain-containing protein [Chloroflexi bacterium]|nr:META domain-containing protein [Chloroflexota bacterium]